MDCSLAAMYPEEESNNQLVGDQSAGGSDENQFPVAKQVVC